MKSRVSYDTVNGEHRSRNIMLCWLFRNVSISVSGVSTKKRKKEHLKVYEDVHYCICTIISKFGVKLEIVAVAYKEVKSDKFHSIYLLHNFRHLPSRQLSQKPISRLSRARLKIARSIKRP